MTRHKSFASDNHAGAHPAVMAAVAAANVGDAPAYGDDDLTRRVEKRFREEFGPQAQAFLVTTGTAANVLGLSLLLRPFEGVICPATAHITTDECGAPERFLGCKLLEVPTGDGKLTPELASSRLVGPEPHHVQPRVVSISQATELGTCYTPGEVAALAAWAHAHRMFLHMDGARLANAAAHVDRPLRDLVGDVDVVSFGGTKNGALAAEAVVVLRPELAAPLPYLRKQGMHLVAKMRFVAAQFLALFDDDLWLRNARHANAMAQRLASGVEGLAGVEVCHPVQANAVFARLAAERVARLQADWDFYVWESRPDGWPVVRWMTAFDTTPSDVDTFVAAVRATA